MPDDLTDDESALVESARAGQVLDRAAPVRAEVIRELLLGRHGELDPRGVRLHGTRVVGPLELDYVAATARLTLVDCVVEELVDVSRATLPQLVLTRSRLAGLQGPGVRVAGDLVLDEVTVERTSAEGAIRLRGAHVEGMLSMERAEVRNDAGPALHAESLRVDGTLFLRGATMSGAGADGAVRLLGAHVGGELKLQHTDLGNDSGPALVANDLVVGSNAFLEHAVVSGAGEKGAIRLRGARIEGLLTMADAEITSTDGPAVAANRLVVGANLLLDRTRIVGMLNFVNARVGNDFFIGDAHLRNGSGPALYADRMQVDGTIALLRTDVSGTGEDGAIWLFGARATGLRLVESEVRNDSGPAVFADQSQARGIRLQNTRLSGSGHATVRLAGASAGGGFFLADTTIEHPDGVFLDVNDFSYTSLAGVDWRRWLDLLRNNTRGYRPSPYQQLAAVERAAGHDGNARDILISQQHDLRHRAPHAIGGRLTRWFHWLWGALAGYGYRARRTALALLVALAAAGGVTLWAGHVATGPGRHAAEHTITSAAPGTACSTVELVGLGLDRGLPLGPTGLRGRCDLDTESTAGQVFTVLLWFVQAAVWGLATLALAGYTGLIRKSA